MYAILIYFFFQIIYVIENIYNFASLVEPFISLVRIREMLQGMIVQRPAKGVYPSLARVRAEL
jgi:hypothetical protein